MVGGFLPSNDRPPRSPLRSSFERNRWLAIPLAFEPKADFPERSPAGACGGHVMEIDEDKIDDAVLALLHLTLGEDGRAWKGFA